MTRDQPMIRTAFRERVCRRFTQIAEARFDALDEGRDTEGPEWAQQMAVIMDSPDWREFEGVPMTSKQLRTLLKVHHCSQREMARQLELSVRTVRHYVSGTLPIPKTVVLALAWVWGMRVLP